MPLSTKIVVRIEADLTNALDLNTVTYPLRVKKEYTWASGTGASQADTIWTDTRTLTASSTEDLDLAGTLTNALGTTVTFAEVAAIYIFAADANTNNVQVGGAASNQFINWVANNSDIVNIRPGGMMLLVAPDSTAYAVTAGTGDLLKIANSAGSTSVTYDIVIIGRSA